MKKYILIGLSIVIFISLYFLTNSWKISLIGFAIFAGYVIWVIGFELGLYNIKDNKEQFEKDFESIKKKHIKRTENNMTLR
jgi:small neutral amino acid transporter SnatA (MarC family)